MTSIGEFEPATKRRGWLAALLSVLVPGLGYLCVGRHGRAFMLGLALIMPIFAFAVALGSSAAFVTFLIFWWTLYFGSAGNAWLLAGRPSAACVR